MYDLLITGGTVIDGSGGPRFRGDVAIHDNKIVAIGDLSHSSAVKVIDATGKVVAPGFIDVNSHADVYWQIFYARGLESLVTQGVTTIIGGNAGSSLAPLTRKQDIRSIQKWTDVEHINLNWLSLAEFFQELEKRKIAVNFATLTGHGTMRRAVMHDQSRSITPEEIAMIKQLLEEALEQGAVGLSTGLKYTHALSAAPREITELVRSVKKYQGVYATYIRNEEEGLIAAVDEALLVGLETKVPVHISHLKAVYQENWNKMDEALERISTAALRGVAVSFDIYPYTSTSSVLYTLLPEWVTRKGRIMMLAQLKDSKVRSAVIQDMKKSDHNYADLLVAVSRVNTVAGHKQMREIALMQGVSIEEAVLSVLLASDGRAIVSHEVLSPLNIEKALQSPHSIVSSNGAGYMLDHGKTGDFVHPRNFGAFPRVLGEYVRKKKILSLEEAIHKMTGKPAEVFGLEKRGLLKKGYFADVVVFDPEVILDKATLDDPYQISVGIEEVLVNGTALVHQGQSQTGEYPGVVLRKKQSSWFS
jgi:N-acyl-D-amino-acid deacylase